MSREYPMLFGYLVLVFGRKGAQDVDVIMDRRHAGVSGREAGSGRAERRAHPEIEEALRQRGYAIVDAGRKSGRRSVELAEPPNIPALRGEAPSDDDGERLTRASRATVVAATLGGIIVGLFIIMAASEDVVGGAARAAVTVIEWARGEGSARTTTTSSTTTPSEASPPVDTAMKSPAAGTAPSPATTTPAPEPVASVPSPTLPSPPRAVTPTPAASTGAPTGAAPAPRVGGSSTVTPAPASRTTPRTVEEPGREAASAPRAAAPAWSGLPRVELSTQSSGSGVKRALAYTVKVSDTEGRPLSGADVWLRVAMPDRSEQETKLSASDPPGTYRGRLTVGTRSPEVSRVRVGIGGTRVEVPVGQPR